MLINPLKPDIFNSHIPKMLIFWAISCMYLGQSNGLGSKLKTIAQRFHSFLTPKFYACIVTNQIWQLESILLYHIKQRDRWLKWTGQIYPKKKKTSLIVPDHIKKQLDLL